MKTETKSVAMRLPLETVKQIDTLQRHHGIKTATELVIFAVKQLWTAPDEPDIRITGADIQPHVSGPEPVQPDPPPVVHKPAYQPPAEVWVKQPQKKYDPVTGEHREWEKIDRRPWTERWLEGGDTDYWPA